MHMVGWLIEMGERVAGGRAWRQAEEPLPDDAEF